MEKILIVDDSKIIQVEFVKYLKSSGYEAVTANNGKEAVEKVQKEPFDLILMDLVMPVMDGFEAIERIREIKSLSFIPIIVISGLETPGDLKKALKLGANEYVFKPIDEVAFDARVQAMLQLKYFYEKGKSSERKYATLLQSLPDVIYKLDLKGNFVFISDSVKSLGYKPQELIGRHFSEIVHPNDLSLVSRSMVLPKYVGKNTGEKNAPKLFDERRSKERATKNLEFRLVPKERSEGKVDSDGLNVMVTIAFGEVVSAGQYDSESKEILGTVGVIRNITERKQAEKEKQILKQKMNKLHSFVDSSINKVLGVSKAINKVHDEIQKVAESDFSIIIQGETGVGKTTLARQIHELSKRSDKPFVKVDIGTLSESLIESELFGHEKGSFTGADRRKKGFFEVTSGGTIFLDEIENMSLSTQSKLLNVIEEKKVYLVGSSKPVKVDFRTIAASNTNIEELVREKKIRQDIYYRLAEHIITLPPLRERPQDILFFSRKFLADTVDELNQPIKMSDEAMEILTHHSWPGNIRELKNIIKNLVLFADDGVITARQVSTIIQDKSNKSSLIVDISLKKALKDYEKNIIKSALINAKGNKSRAAFILQTSYRNLLTKINEYGI